MKSIVYPSEIHGSIVVPSSKSYAQRAILSAAVYGRPTRINGLNLCDDTKVALNAAEDLGCDLQWSDDHLIIKPSNGEGKNQFFAGESGLTCRLLAAILLLKEGKNDLDGLPSLRKRPLAGVKEVADQLNVTYKDNNGFLPVTFEGSPTSASLVVDGSLSSQFASGLLMALPTIGFSDQLVIENLKSRPYIDMTISMLKSFGVSWIEGEHNVFTLSEVIYPHYVEVAIERDWSAAASIIAAGAIAGNIHLNEMNTDSLQADKKILTLNNLFEFDDNAIQVGGRIEPFNFDASHCPDLFPALVAMGHYAQGTCRIEGVHRLRHKESNRGEALKSEFNKLGGDVRIEDDTMIIEPSELNGGVVDGHGDHRIVMALAAAGLGAKSEVTILGAESVDKSYPNFFEDIKSLGANVQLID